MLKNNINTAVKKIGEFIELIDLSKGAKSGEIAHHNRSKPHSRKREKAGQDYCTSSVRHGPESAQFSLRIPE
ncbi:MAG: hypothetical protein Q8N39_03180, partial [Pelolinea sp.]|nr:hypothetical protein [Pelolinea sp.]